jgi:uncharacterized protein (DUF58 family)
VRIPKTSVQTSWRADWLVEFSIALIALAFLAREIFFAVVGAGILLALASLGLLFHRGLEILRRELDVVERLPKARTFLGDDLEGDLTIRNGSRLAARILAVRPVVEEGLSVKLSPSLDQVLRPGTASSSKFEVALLKSGRFRISGFTLAFTDSRGLFTGEVNYEQADWVEVYPSVRTKVPITPLRLYGGGPEIFRKGPAGMDYAGVRQYVPGDEYHRIEWKATARLRTLMVKEFHPEVRTALQILIDAGKTMHQPCYVGTRLDEALAVAELLVEYAVTSRNQVGIWIYDEAEIVQAMEPATAKKQLDSLRRLALVLRAQTAPEQVSIGVAPPAETPRLGTGSFLGVGLTRFVRVLRLRLTSAYRKTGVCKALAESTSIGLGGVFVILTDLQTNGDVLLEAVSGWGARGLTIVAQVGAPWRFSDSLEEAYAKYQSNDRMLRCLQHSNLSVFDHRPEMLVEAIAQGTGKHISYLHAMGS